jgi:hypothetical protein
LKPDHELAGQKQILASENLLRWTLELGQPLEKKTVKDTW